MAVVLEGSALAVNRFYLGDQVLPLGSVGNTVSVFADLDQESSGFSVNLGFDSLLLRVTGLKLGAHVAALSPEFSAGSLSHDPGVVFHGVVFSLSDPTSKTLTPGAGKELLKVTLDVAATLETATVLDLFDIAGTPQRNVIVDSMGNSLAPELADGTLSLLDFRPTIEGYQGNRGRPGQEFFVLGRNFDQEGLGVTVCGQSAAFTLVDERTLRVVATECVAGPAEVTVCTSFGCASDPTGFVYEPRMFLRADANNDSRIDISDAVTLILNIFRGFLARAPCQDALDANDSGRIDISDPIYLLNYIFRGGPSIPPPYPQPGEDPTLDSLPAC